MQLCKVQIGTGMQVQESATQQLTEAVTVWQHERNMTLVHALGQGNR